MARPTKAKAIERLRRALDAIPELEQLPYRSSKFEKWERATMSVIFETFGSRSPHMQDFTYSIKDYSDSLSLKPTESVLKSMIEEIEEYWDDENQTPQSPTVQEHERTNTKEVFVIHGRDNEAKETVARFLTRLDLTPVILHEQPNQGRTIIEKFERNAQVKFAVALLTPDDVGALKDDEKNLKPRARQNVVFELGYFLGRLGRERVCALTKGNVEIPSDYDGVVYISLDDGGWKIDLIRELKNVGFGVDANKAL